jgi:hypothetical protein
MCKLFTNSQNKFLLQGKSEKGVIKPDEKRPLGNLSVEGRILKCILNKWEVVVVTEST